MTWNIDASWAVHPDCKNHTGAACTLGHGTFISISLKQKLVTKSSIGSELMAFDNAMTFVMWAKHFFEWQVKDLKEMSSIKQLGKHVILEQDNTSAIQLERNGLRLSTKRTKHINC